MAGCEPSSRLETKFVWSVLACALVAVGAAACGGGTTNPTYDNPSELRIENGTRGSIIYVHARACGTTDWGDDLFMSDHPVDGTIAPDATRTFILEAGCYDIRAQHLESSIPGPLIDKFLNNQTLSTDSPVEWRVTHGTDPDEPS